MFTKTDGKVLLRTKTGYKEADVYRRDSNNVLMAKVGQNYIILKANNRTTLASTSWEELSGVEHKYNNVGWMVCGLLGMGS